MLLLDKFVTIERLALTSGNKSSYSTFTTSLESTIQPLSDSKTSLYGGDFGKMYKVYLDVSVDVEEGDRVTDKDGNIYQIVAGGKEKRDDGFMTDYMGLTVKKIND